MYIYIDIICIYIYMYIYIYIYTCFTHQKCVIRLEAMWPVNSNIHLGGSHLDAWKLLSPSRMFSLFFKGSWYHTVDGRKPANQLRLVVYPIIYRVLYIPSGAGFLPSTVSYQLDCKQKIDMCVFLGQFHFHGSDPNCFSLSPGCWEGLGFLFVQVISRVISWVKVPPIAFSGNINWGFHFQFDAGVFVMKWLGLGIIPEINKAVLLPMPITIHHQNCCFWNSNPHPEPSFTKIIHCPSAKKSTIFQPSIWSLPSIEACLWWHGCGLEYFLGYAASPDGWGVDRRGWPPWGVAWNAFGGPRRETSKATRAWRMHGVKRRQIGGVGGYVGIYLVQAVFWI